MKLSGILPEQANRAPRPDLALRVSLLMVPLAAAFGPLFPVAGPLYLYRLLVLVLLFLAVFRNGRAAFKRPASSMGKLLLATAALWIAWGLLSALLHGPGQEAFSALATLSSGLILMFVAARTLEPLHTARLLAAGYQVAVVVTGMVAIWEYLTHNHLSNYGMDATYNETRGINPIASTFGNPNAFAVFLVFAISAGLFQLFLAESARSKFVHAAFLGGTFALLIVSEGRSSLAAGALMVLVALTYWGRRAVLIGAVSLGTLFVMAVGGVLAGFDTLVPTRLREFSWRELDFLGSQGANSASVRFDLVTSGLRALVDTFGLGVGPGGFSEWVERNTTGFAADAGAFSPHNAVVELATEYGVVVFALVTISASACFRSGFRAIRTGEAYARAASLLVVTTMVAFPLYSIANSTFWNNPMIWVAAAWTLCCCAVCRTVVSASTRAPAGQS